MALPSMRREVVTASCSCVAVTTTLSRRRLSSSIRRSSSGVDSPTSMSYCTAT